MTPSNAANTSKTPAPQSFSPDNPSPSTKSPPAPGSGEPPSTATPTCAESSKNTAPHGREAHTLSGLTTEIAHLRIALDAIAATVRRHEEELRRLRKTQH